MSSPEYANAVEALKALSREELGAIQVTLHELRWEEANGKPFPTRKTRGAEFAKPIAPESFGVKEVLSQGPISPGWH